MSLIRWLSVTLLTLTAGSAAYAQIPSLAMLGLSTSFGVESATESRPLAEPQELCEINVMPALVPECLKYWKEQWSQGNYRAAQIMAGIACRLDPTNATARHALALAEIMQGLATAKDCCEECTERAATMKENAARTMRAVSYPVADLVGAVRCANAGEAQCPGEAIVDFLINLIQCTVANDTWVGAGGRASIEYYPLAQAIVVRQTQDAQESVADLLTRLRLAVCPNPYDTQVVFGAGSVRLPFVRTTATETVSEAPACCKEAGCCAAASAAAGAAKILQAVLTKTTAACACDKDCGCCKSAAPAAKPQSVAVPPAPFMVIGEVSSGAVYCPYQEGYQPMPMTGPHSGTGPMYTFPAPIYVTGQFAMPPMPYDVPLPPSVYHPGRPQGLPTPAQVMQDLEWVRSAAANKVLAAAPPMEASPEPIAKQKVRLAMPQLEASCDRLTSAAKPDHVLLEGDVQLICHRNGQTFRIKSQRILVNLTEGTFTAESAPVAPPEDFMSRFERHQGIFTAESVPAVPPRMPTAHVRPPASMGTYYQIQPASYTVPSSPWQMVRPVRPVNDMPDYIPFKPED